MRRPVAIVCPVLLLCCGKHTPVEKMDATRDQATSYLAATACDRYDDCQGFNSDKTFQTRDACESEYKMRALSYWPADACSTECIDPAKFEACLEALMTKSCTKDFWDAVQKTPACAPATVCTNGGCTPPSPPAPVASSP
jgi:hypothetical protein